MQTWKKGPVTHRNRRWARAREARDIGDRRALKSWSSQFPQGNRTQGHQPSVRLGMSCGRSGQGGWFVPEGGRGGGMVWLPGSVQSLLGVQWPEIKVSRVSKSFSVARYRGWAQGRERWGFNQACGPARGVFRRERTKGVESCIP